MFIVCFSWFCKWFILETWSPFGPHQY